MASDQNCICVVVLGGVIVVGGLIVILLPMSFSGLEYYQVKLIKFSKV